MTNRREFVIGTVASATAALGFLPSASFGSTAPSNSSQEPSLPLEHVGYDFVLRFAQRGLVTGLPDGTFVGKYPVSRQKFVWALRTIYSQLLSWEGSGACLPRRRSLDTPRVVRALNNELLGDFAAQGGDIGRATIDRDAVRAVLALAPPAWGDRSSFARSPRIW